MASFNFYCRPSKSDKKGYSPIELSILIDGKRSYIALPRKEKPSDFSKAMTSKRLTDIRQYVDLMHVKVNEAITDILKAGKALTTDELKDYMRTGGVKAYTIKDLFDECFAILEQYLKPVNFYKYCLVRDEFYKHIDMSLDVTSITNAVIKSFYSKTYKTYKQSTAAGKMAKLKYVVKFGLDNGKLTVNPFSTVRISKPRGTVEYLTDEEVETIKAHDFHNDRLNAVRDCFLFQCGSGLAYADMASLRPEDIQEDNGTYYIIKGRQKTDIEFTAVLLPWAVEIINKYNGVLPVISNQKMNSYLKEIGDICGIKHNLHSHLARKTYCTHLLNSGVRMEVVSKCCGHANTKITAAIYAHLQTQTIINEVVSTIK